MLSRIFISFAVNTDFFFFFFVGELGVKPQPSDPRRQELSLESHGYLLLTQVPVRISIYIRWLQLTYQSFVVCATRD